eukprot:scaffold58077_cov47-Attheya_sp.AAC.1
MARKMIALEKRHPGVPSFVTGGLLLRVPTNNHAAAQGKGNVFPVVQKMMDGDDFCEDDELGEGDLDTPSVMLDDLNWRVEKLRLEEQNIQRFLKSGPRHLPYEECRKWVQAWNRWDTEDDWNEWISMGEKRNTYIPGRPDEYYGRLGQWISWDHFLLGKAEPPDTTNNNGSNDPKGDNDE